MAISLRTWIAGELVTAALMNAQIRDNLTLMAARMEAADGSLDLLTALSVAASQNTSTGETDLTGYSFSVAAARLADGEGYTIFGGGSLANNTNTKTFRIDIGGQKTTLFVDNVAAANRVFNFRLFVRRISSTTARIDGVVHVFVLGAAAAFVYPLLNGVTSLAWSGATTIKFTGQGGATGDIVMVGYNVVENLLH